MSTDRDTTRIVRSWLEEGATELTDRVLDAVLDQLSTTPQRRATWWPARRFPEMNATAKLALGIAAVVVVAFLGFNYLVAPGVGGPGLGDPTATPAPSTSARPLSGDELDAGAYRLSVVGGVFATVTVPDGWENVQGMGVGRDSGGDGSAAVVVFWTSDSEVSRVYADPCRWLEGFVDPLVGPTVDDLATALADQPQRGDAVPVDVSIGGYQGKMIELSVPDDIELADCDRGEFRSWEGRWHQGPGQIDRVYILDVGGQRVVIDAHFLPGTPQAALEQQQTVLDSIQIDAP